MVYGELFVLTTSEILRPKSSADHWVSSNTNFSGVARTCFNAHTGNIRKYYEKLCLESFLKLVLLWKERI